MPLNKMEEEQFWSQRYEQGETGWDIGQPSTPLKTYIDQLNNKDLKILIPGAGNAYEAEYLWKKGFKNVSVADISLIPLQKFMKRNPDFPEAQLLHVDYFLLEGQFDLILEQTFFCSFVPTDYNRNKYAKKTAELLQPSGKLVGLWFNFPLSDDFEKRPFGGNKTLYLNHLLPYFKTISFEPCYNSVSPRQDKELFGIFVKK